MTPGRFAFESVCAAHAVMTVKSMRHVVRTVFSWETFVRARLAPICEKQMHIVVGNKSDCGLWEYETSGFGAELLKIRLAYTSCSTLSATAFNSISVH